jgi:hypothetical protein
MLMRHPPIPQRIGFHFGKILADVGRRQFVNVGEQVLQPGVTGLLGGSDEDAKIVRRHLLCGYDSDSLWFREPERAHTLE